MTDDEQLAEFQDAGMDGKPIDWAWAQQVANNPGARVVLMCLARRVDDSWVCTASQEEVAMDALIPARSVRRYLDHLEEGGWIARQRRVDEKGHRLSDSYHLNPGESLLANLDAREASRADSYRPDRPVGKLDGGPDLQEHPAANLDDRHSLPADVDSRDDSLWPDWPVGESGETQTRRSDPVAKLPTGQIGHAVVVVTNNSSSTKKNNKPSTTKGGAGGKRTRQTSEEHPRFAEWYAAYPLRKERAAAVKAFTKAAAKVEDLQTLFDAAKLYADTDPHVLRGYIKNPATWLNKECWLDEPAPRLALVRNDSPSPGSIPQQFTEEDYRAGW